MRNDLPKAITAEDVIRRFDLNSLVKNRKAIQINKETLDKTENILYKFIDSTLKGITNTEDQVDGKVTTWFFDGVPTLLNNPASNWRDEKTKNAHIGDLYYDKDNGNTYEFSLNEDTYSWEIVQDENINQAMALANSNPDTADGNRNIFVIDPITPYEVGDIWIKSNGDIYRCNVARESGALNEAEWVISSEYSNDNYAYDARAIIDQFTEYITASYVCKVLVKTTKDSIELSVSSATTKITNDYTTAISQSEGRAEIREGQVLLQANKYTSGEIARVEGEIGDIADITQVEEKENAKVSFTNVPQSEPININIHPINENISYLYPNSQLFPSSNLYLKVRTLRFTNLSDYELTEDTYYNNYRKYYSYDGNDYTLLVAGTDYTIGSAINGAIYQNTYVDYILPDDLLYYDSENYDLFELDYGNQICRVTKKCKYNADGTVSKLNDPIITDYEYPTIPLELGDYDIQILGYTSGYIYARLMSNNVYVGQFVTKTKLDASINVLPHQIDLTTAELISGTSCGITIKLRDANGNVLDSKEANITLSGKVAFDDLSQSGRTTINGSNITTGTLNGNLVNVTNINATNITSGVLKSHNYVAGTSGTSINLSTGVIDTKNFKVSSTGAITATGANISGTITATAGEIGGCSISGGVLQIANANIVNATITGTKIANGTITNAKIADATITSAKISSVSADKITTGTMSANRISGGTIDANNVTINNLNASKITTGTISTSRLSTDVITTSNFSAQNINANNIKSGTLSGRTISGCTINGSTFNTAHCYITGTTAQFTTSKGWFNMGVATNVAPYSNGLNSAGAITFYQGGNNSTLGKYCGAVSLVNHGGGINDLYFTAATDSAVIQGYNIYLDAREGNVYASRNNGSNYKISTEGGSISSLKLKENLEIFDDSEYSKAYELLQNIDIYRFNYKYEGISSNKNEYGFIIDYIEKNKDYDKFLYFEDERAIIKNNQIDYAIRKDEENNIIDFKKYNENNIIRYLFTLAKSMQLKIDELERRLVHE